MAQIRQKVFYHTVTLNRRQIGYTENDRRGTQLLLGFAIKNPYFWARPHTKLIYYQAAKLGILDQCKKFLATSFDWDLIKKGYKMTNKQTLASFDFHNL